MSAQPWIGFTNTKKKKKALSAGIGITKAVAVCLFLWPLFLPTPTKMAQKKKVCSPVFPLKSHLRGLTPTFKMPVQGLPPRTARGLQNSC